MLAALAPIVALSRVRCPRLVLGVDFIHQRAAWHRRRFDVLLTEGLARSLAALSPAAAEVSLLKGSAAEHLADAITRQLATILEDVPGDDADQARRQLELVNGNATSNSNPHPTSAWARPGCSPPARVRLRCCRRSAASWRPATRSTSASALELDGVYRSGTGQGRSSWTALRRDAGLIVAEPGPEEDYFSLRFGDLLHVDDPRRLDVMAAAGGQQGQVQGLDSQAALGLQMPAY